MLVFKLPLNILKARNQIHGGIRTAHISFGTLGGALHMFWVRGRAIGKGIDFPNIGIRNSIDFCSFGMGTVPIFKILI